MAVATSSPFWAPGDRLNGRPSSDVSLERRSPVSSSATSSANVRKTGFLRVTV